MGDPRLVAAHTTTPCPKCNASMVLATVIPHQINSGMTRHTYVCERCNQTRTYILQAN
jgi:transposase-like protein